MFHFLLSAVVAVAPFSAVNDVDLWRSARTGQSIQTVRSLFPSVHSPQTAQVLTGGDVDRLELDGVELYGQVFTARFYFGADRLTSVQLVLTTLAPASSARNISAAKSISGALSTEYGPGYDCGDQSATDISTYECKWLKTPVSIRLRYLDVAGQAPFLLISYRQAGDPSYDL
jgi:hypothetical protein